MERRISLGWVAALLLVTAALSAGGTFVALKGLPFDLPRPPIAWPAGVAQPEPPSQLTPVEGGLQLPQELLASRSFARFLKAYELIQRYHLDPGDREKMLDGAAEGMVKALGDPYSYYMDPERYKDVVENTRSGKYVGIGVLVDTRDGRPTLRGVMPDTPAERAGLRTGDIITQIDGTFTWGLTVDEVRALVRGEKGTPANLVVSRANVVQPLSVTVIRDEIDRAPVFSHMLEGKVGYLRIGAMVTDTPTRVQAELAALRSGGMRGLIIDLRDNPGGGLQSAVNILRQIVPTGPVYQWTGWLWQERPTREKVVEQVRGRGLNLPLVVLVNEGSASASELIAKAIQGRGLGTVVGTVTTGKGIGQTTLDLPDGYKLQLTTFEYFGPDGGAVNKIGVKPDVEVKQDPPAPGEPGIHYEDIADRRNVQLHRAVEVLRELMKR